MHCHRILNKNAKIAITFNQAALQLSQLQYFNSDANVSETVKDKSPIDRESHLQIECIIKK